MKICVIGNSHLAALKLGWDGLAKQYEDKVELFFFGSPGATLVKGIAANDSCLYPTKGSVKQHLYNTSGGMTSIKFAEFDAIFITGLGCKFDHLFETLKTHKTTSSTYHQDAAYKTISVSCLIQVCVDQQKNVGIFRVISLIRTVSDIPIYLLPCPLPSKACSEDRPFLVANASKKVQESFYQGLSSICKLYSVTLLTQPENTVTDFIFTKEIFSQGSARLNLTTIHSDTDYAHMNQEYGKEILTHVLPIICRGK